MEIRAVFGLFKTLAICNDIEEAIKHNYFWSIFEEQLPKVFNGFFNLHMLQFGPYFIYWKSVERSNDLLRRHSRSVSISLIL